MSKPPKGIVAAETQIALLKSRGMKPIPIRRWTRALRAAGVPVIHGPVSAVSEGNWAPAWVVETFELTWKLGHASMSPRRVVEVALVAIGPAGPESEGTGPGAEAR